MIKSRYRGSFVDCLGHFKEIVTDLFGSSGGAVGEKLQKIFGLKQPLIHWCENHNLPRGVNLVKLELLLLYLGYSYTDRREHNDRIRLMALVIGGVGSDSIGEQVGVTSGSVFRWARGTLLPNDVRQEKLRQLLDEPAFCQKIDPIINEWQTYARGIASFLPDQSESEKGKEKKAKEDLSSELRLTVVTSLANIVNAGIPLAKTVLSDGFSPEDRKMLRELTTKGPTHGVFELSNLLNGLCGEKARSTTNGK